jgi:hypothetical protein
VLPLDGRPAGGKAMSDYIYPLTIVSDRYGGVYSCGKWTAWNLYPQELPPAQDADDCTCSDFWLDTDLVIGRGATPREAVKDLERRLAEEGR